MYSHSSPRTFRMLLLLIVSAALQASTTLEITACNCSQASIVGALNTEEITDCTHVAILEKPTTAEYMIFSNIKESYHFTGYACSRFKRVVSIVGNFWQGSYFTEKSSHEEAVSAADCWHMHFTHSCHGRPMYPSNSDQTTWAYDVHQPPATYGTPTLHS